MGAAVIFAHHVSLSSVLPYSPGGDMGAAVIFAHHVSLSSVLPYSRANVSLCASAPGVLCRKQRVLDSLGVSCL